MTDPAPLLEIRRIGNVLRVAALDPRTLAEAVFMAPAAADRTVLLRLAHRKLARMNAEAARSLPVARGQPFL
ncbi:hypothetical protein SH611_16900 [Geminicoccaceae bacterium 1502E]|nr:hypothetical protein [Geminicoccaceae bacterium 1502E]